MLKNVITKYGEVEGVLSEKGYALFKGIPYAAPPVGELRWKPSIDPIPWEGVRKCDTWGAACVQGVDHGNSEVAYGKEFYAGDDYPPVLNEDCLFLNIWTPAEKGDEKLPVMMWMHGGGVQSGYSHEIEFDGDAICDRGVILVTINYRLNIFGYFSHPELTAESEHDASGNYGIHDQIQALRWIHENIAAFGGDPDNVTIFGQSGGGRSTQALSCSPLTKGLVRRAIVQSAGGIATAAGRLLRTDLERRGMMFMEYAGCKNMTELRAIPAAEIFTLFRAFTREKLSPREAMSCFNISTDGYALPLSLEDTVVQGKQNDLDYMLGCTSGDMGNILASLSGWARMQHEHGKKPVYMYRFERELPTDDPTNEKELKGAFHSSELWYTFGTLGRCWRPMTEGDYELSRIMCDCWTNFAKSGNPNGDSLPEWPLYDNTMPKMMTFNVPECGGCNAVDVDPDGKIQDAVNELLENLK